MNAFKIKLGLVAVSSLALILTACGGGTDTGGGTMPAPVVTPPKYTKLGSISVTSGESFRVLGGSFFKSPNSFAQPASPTGIAEDTCQVTKNPAPGQVPNISTLIENIESLDAGAELNVKKAGETLAVLKPQSNLIFPKLKSYSSDIGAVIPDVSAATLEIPGATGGFPAITVTLPNELAAFTFGPTREVSKDTVFTWTGATSGALVTFAALSGTGADAVSVYCTAKDDGSFSFPDATKTELTAKGFTTGSAPSASKGISKTLTKDDALLIVTASRSSTFVL